MNTLGNANASRAALKLVVIESRNKESSNYEMIVFEVRVKFKVNS